MDQPLYYVNGASKFELGPFTRPELQEALEQGDINATDRVRSDLGKELGTVSSVLKSSGRQRTHSSGRKALEGEQRYTVITTAVILVLLFLIGCMVYALHTSSPPQVTAQPVPIEAPAPPVEHVPPPVPAPTFGIKPGTVATFLARPDPIAAIKLTRAGEPNHLYAIANAEGPANIMDGTVDSKYFTPVADGTRAPGVNDGFVVTTPHGGVVTAFQIATANDHPDRDPITITIEGSNDPEAGHENGNGFVLIYSGTTGLEVDPGRKGWGPSVTFDNARLFMAYRVLVTRTRSRTDGTQLSEMRLGTLVPPP